MEPKESPYYRGNHECLPTILQVKTTEGVITQELPWDPSIEDLVHAFFTACVGMTFIPSTVIEGMKAYVEEHEECICGTKKDDE